MSEQIAAEGYKLGEHHHLGPLMITFRARDTQTYLLYALYFGFVVPFLALVIACTFGFFLTLSSYANIYYLIAVALFVLYTASFYLWWTHQYGPILPSTRQGDRVHVYQPGMIYIRDGHAEVIRWEEMTRIRCQQSSRKDQHQPNASLKIWRSDGKKFSFDGHLMGIATLVTLVEREYTKRQPDNTTATIQ